MTTPFVFKLPILYGFDSLGFRARLGASDLNDNEQLNSFQIRQNIGG